MCLLECFSTFYNIYLCFIDSILSFVMIHSETGMNRYIKFIVTINIDYTFYGIIINATIIKCISINRIILLNCT